MTTAPAAHTRLLVSVYTLTTVAAARVWTALPSFHSYSATIMIIIIKAKADQPDHKK